MALCVLAGTIGSGLELVNEGGPLLSYDWFGASRVIEGTINEFPAFSFTLADLHGHVMAIPFSLLALAFGLQLATGRAAAAAARARRARARRGGDRDRDAVRDQRVVVPRRRRARAARRAGAGGPGRRPCASASGRGWVIAVLLLAVIAVLPFLLAYDAAANGLGRVTERASFSSWASDHGALYGLFAYLVATAYARAARALAPSVAHRGLDGGGGAVRRLAAGDRRPRRGRRPGRARWAARARGVLSPAPRPSSASSGC